MSDTGDNEFKSLFDDDLDKTKGRKSAGLYRMTQSMVKAQQTYCCFKITYIKTLTFINTYPVMYL